MNMKSIGFFSLIVFGSVGFASTLDAPDVALSAIRRTEIIEQLRAISAGSEWWSEYYSYGPVDRAYLLGRAEGFRQASDILEAAR